MQKMVKKIPYYYQHWFRIIITICTTCIGFLLPFVVSLFYKPVRNGPGLQTFQLTTTFIVIIPTTIVGIILFKLLKFSKKEIAALLISGIFVLAWEVFVETFLGWRLDLWYFMPDEPDVLKVMLGGLRVGIDFYCCTFIIGTLGLYFWRQHPRNFGIMVINLILFTVFLGWASDVFVGLMDTPIVTLFVWSVLVGGYTLLLMLVRYLFTKEGFKSLRERANKIALTKEILVNES